MSSTRSQEVNGTELQKVSGIEFQELKIFEAGLDVPPEEMRDYKSEFSKSNTRRIYCELHVKNLLYNQQEQTHKVTWRFIKSDGSVWGEPTLDFVINAEWYTSWIYTDWGWDVPGNWPVDSYVIEVWVGDVKLGSKAFTIVDDRDAYAPLGLVYPPEDPQIEFESIFVYESEKGIPDFADREYKTEFLSSETRFINFELNTKNLVHNVRDNMFKVTWKYYGPGDELMGEGGKDYNFLKEHARPSFSEGRGWETAGNWPPGIHRIEVWFGDMKFAEREFTIIDDLGEHIPSGLVYPSDDPQIEFESLYLFESGKGIADLDEREYKTEFFKSQARYINFELNTKNLAYGVKDNTFMVKWKYYAPDGDLEGEDQQEYDWSKDMRLPSLAQGRGWEEAGYWEIGVHRVEIWVGDMKFAEQEFTIVDDREQYVVDGFLYPKSNPQIEFEYLQIFDANPVEGDPRSMAQDEFSVSTTACIYIKFGVKNLLYDVSENTYKVTLKYYLPDGMLFAELPYDFEIEKGWETAWYYDSYGWDSPGNWALGIHRVEIWIEGTRFAEREFTITGG